MDTNYMTLRGAVSAKKIPGYQKASWTWTLKNVLTWEYLWGLISNKLAIAFSKLTGIPTLTAELSAIKIDAYGRKTDYGIISRRVVTDAGVAFIVDAWQNSVEMEIMKYHGCGTGGTAEGASQTALVTECTTALNPDSTRATGTLAEGGTGNIFSTVGTPAFDASAAVTEHGLFSQAATGGGTMFDRSLFSAINVVSGDSIQFTYTCTFTSGG